MKNVSLRELEVLTTTRVVCDRFATHRKQYITKYQYLEALKQAVYALNDTLVERKLNGPFWARVRGYIGKDYEPKMRATRNKLGGSQYKLQRLDQRYKV